MVVADDHNEVVAPLLVVAEAPFQGVVETRFWRHGYPYFLSLLLKQYQPAIARTLATKRLGLFLGRL